MIIICQAQVTGTINKQCKLLKLVVTCNTSYIMCIVQLDNVKHYRHTVIKVPISEESVYLLF